MTDTVNPDTHWQQQVNRHCHLPKLSNDEAYKLWHAIINLLSALSTLRRMKSGSRQSKSRY